MLPTACPPAVCPATCRPTLLADFSSAAARFWRNEFWRDESGATLVEYVLLVALIAVVCAGAVTILGTSTSTKLNSAATSLQ